MKIRINSRLVPVTAFCILTTLLASCTLDREGIGIRHPLDHFYTTDPREAENALNNLGYIVDGVPLAGYIFEQPHTELTGISTVPLYRLYSGPQIDDHFYTIDADERATALAGNYIDDGVPIAGHVYPQQMPGTLPFYRLWLSVNQGGNHFYTTDAAERDRAVNDIGYVYEGIEGYIYPANNGSVPGTLPFYRLYRPEN